MIKRVLYLVPVLFIFLSACDKNQNNDNLHVTCPAGPLLNGPWDLNAFWNSPGAGELTWFPATQSVSISFNGNNVFSSTRDKQDHYYTTLSTYNQVTDTIIKLYKQGSTDTAAYILKINRDTLYLYNMGCIEGCAEKYARPNVNVIQ
jgi:hypothetical protein